MAALDHFGKSSSSVLLFHHTVGNFRDIEDFLLIVFADCTYQLGNQVMLLIEAENR